MKTITFSLLFSFLITPFFTLAQGGIYRYESPKHFVGVVNTGVNMTLGILATAWDKLPEVGDEIAAFNEIGQLVGSSVYLDGNTALSIWGDDEYTTEKDGCLAGTKFELRLWKQSTGEEYRLIVKAWFQGDDLYKTNGISVISELMIEAHKINENQYSLNQNQPNPARSFTEIGFHLPVKTTCVLAIYSVEGKLVKEIYTGTQEAGSHNITVDVSSLGTGHYLYKLSTPEFTATKPMNVLQ